MAPKNLPKESKIAIRRQASEGKSLDELAVLYMKSKRTIERVLIIPEAQLMAMPRNARRITTPKYPAAEAIVLALMAGFRRQGNPINGVTLKLLALSARDEILANLNCTAADRLLYSAATFGKSWLDGFKKRQSIRMVRIVGESAALPENWELSMRLFVENLGRLNVNPENILNLDETGLFYRKQPPYTLARAGDNGAGGKADKSRITAAFIVNATGTYRKTILIGKSMRPHETSAAFWQEHQVDYYNNATSWMTAAIFKQVVFKLNREFVVPHVLIMDNFAGHVLTDAEWQSFPKIIPMFLPPNTTSRTQPLDGGIISMFKVNYMKTLVLYRLQRFREGGFAHNEIKIARIVPWVKNAFLEMSNRSILKCWRKTVPLPSIVALDDNAEEAPPIEANAAAVADELVQIIMNFLAPAGFTRANVISPEAMLMNAIDQGPDGPIEGQHDGEEDIVEEGDPDAAIRVADPRIIRNQMVGLLEYWVAIGYHDQAAECRAQLQEIDAILNADGLVRS